MSLSDSDGDVPESVGEFRRGLRPYSLTLGIAFKVAPVRDNQHSQNKPATTLQQQYDSTANSLSSPSRRSAPPSNASETRIETEHGPNEDDSTTKGDESKRGSKTVRTRCVLCARNVDCLLLTLMIYGDVITVDLGPSNQVFIIHLEFTAEDTFHREGP
jgi:hypothetical protein